MSRYSYKKKVSWIFLKKGAEKLEKWRYNTGTGIEGPDIMHLDNSIQTNDYAAFERDLEVAL